MQSNSKSINKSKSKNKRLEIIYKIFDTLCSSPTIIALFTFISCYIVAINIKVWYVLLIPIVYIISSYQRIIFEILLMIHVIKHFQGKWIWWHKITPNIYLGSIPMKFLNHSNILKDELGINHVISLNEDYEMVATTMIGSVIMTEEWKLKNIQHSIFLTADFQPPSFDILNKASLLLHNSITNKKQIIYIHCKSGMGRSVSVVIAYLINYYKKDNMTVDQAYQYIKNIRPQIFSKRSKQLINLRNYQNQINQEKEYINNQQKEEIIPI